MLLKELLKELFTEKELDTFYREYTTKVLPEETRGFESLPKGNAETAERLFQHGIVDDDFFRCLFAARPDYLGDINKVAVNIIGMEIDGV